MIGIDWQVDWLALNPPDEGLKFEVGRIKIINNKPYCPALPVAELAKDKI